jgi:hypothetical protein
MRQALAREGRGAAMLEFAVVAPVVILLMLGMADLALVVAGNSAGGNSAREGARYGIINFDCADAYAGSTTYSSAACSTAPSTNYTGIANVVTRRISGLVRNGSITVAVRCVDGSDTNLTSKACTKAGITPDKDMIEVKVSWTSLGASPYAATSHTDLARLMIQGVPSTTIASATTTTTAAPTTTTTTLVPTTTTTAAPVCPGDTTPPTGDFTISDGTGADPGFTNSTSLTINPNFTDPCSPMSMQFSTDGGATFGAYTAYGAIALVTSPAGDGTKSVVAHVKDAAGNVVTKTHSIVLDTTNPSTPTLTIACSTSGSTTTADLSWATATDANLKEYLVADNDGSITTTTVVAAGTTTFSTSHKKQTAHTFTVQAADKAGNKSTSQAIVC